MFLASILQKVFSSSLIIQPPLHSEVLGNTNWCNVSFRCKGRQHQIFWLFSLVRYRCPWWGTHCARKSKNSKFPLKVFFSKTFGVYTCNCDDRYGYLMRENMLCAGEEGKDSCSGLNLVWEIYFYLNCWHQLGCRWQWRSTCLPPWWRFDSTPGRGHFLGPGLWQVQQPFANLPIQILTYYYYQHRKVLYDGATSIRRWLLT